MNANPDVSRIRKILLDFQIKEWLKAFLIVFMDILCYEPFVPLIFVKITAILFKHSFCVPDDVYSMVRLELSTFHFYTHYEMTAHLINTSYAFGDDIASSIWRNPFMKEDHTLSKEINYLLPFLIPYLW